MTLCIFDNTTKTFYSDSLSTRGSTKRYENEKKVFKNYHISKTFTIFAIAGDLAVLPFIQDILSSEDDNLKICKEIAKLNYESQVIIYFPNNQEVFRISKNDGAHHESHIEKILTNETLVTIGSVPFDTFNIIHSEFPNKSPSDLIRLFSKYYNCIDSNVQISASEF